MLPKEQRSFFRAPILGTGAIQRLVEAAKFIINKTVQDKETGAITVFDDDDSTPLVTLTPVETDTEITKNRSES